MLCPPSPGQHPTHPLINAAAGADTRLEGVNRPELLPQEYTNTASSVLSALSLIPVPYPPFPTTLLQVLMHACRA